MSRRRPGPGHALTAAALVPVPLRRRRLLLRWLATMLLTAAVASAATALLMPMLMQRWTPARPQAAAPQPDRQPLQQQIEQLRLELGVAQAHGAELERQIDTLTQRGRQCQEELVFFRQSGRRTAP